MPNLLKNYLREVESYLSSLPTVIRRSELREIDGHLQQIAADLKTQGLNEDDASTRATQRFGSARSLGLHLRDTWERNRAPLPVAFAVVLSNWFFMLPVSLFLSALCSP